MELEHERGMWYVVCGLWYVVCAAALEAMKDVEMRWNGRLQATLRTQCFRS